MNAIDTHNNKDNLKVNHREPYGGAHVDIDLTSQATSESPSQRNEKASYREPYGGAHTDIDLTSAAGS